MVQAIRMPMMGNTMEIGLLVEWRVEESEAVDEGDVIAIVESEKASAEVAADRSGVLARVDVHGGEEVPPGTVLGIVAGPDEDLDDAPAPRSRLDPDGAASERSDDEETAETEAGGGDGGAGESAAGAEGASGVRAAPGARKVARERDVDLAAIDGSGPEGAVLRSDVEARVEVRGDEPDGEGTTSGSRTFARPAARRLARELGVSMDEIGGTGVGNRVTESDVRAAGGADRSRVRSGGGTGGGDDDRREVSDPAALGVTIAREREPSRLRRTIADRMSQSARRAPHVTNKREVPVEDALQAADDLAASADAPVGFTDVLVAAVTRALEAHPEFNAWYEGGRLRLVAERNVAIAVDTDAGLVTPVIRETGSRTFESIAGERRRLTDAALGGDYDMDDLRGGTFTITNLGMFGVDSFDPIINPPQVAILGVGRIRDEDGERRCTLSLSFDHRAVDGADAARFLDTIADGLASPSVLATERAKSGREPAETRSDASSATDAAGEDDVRSAVARDVRDRARDVASAHDWPVPDFEVHLGGERPSVTVTKPNGASTATMKRLTYAACRESTYAGTIAGLHDPDVTVVAPGA